MSESLTTYLDFARETAFLAGRLTLGHYQTGLSPDYKSDDSPVTVADRQAEQFIRQRIEARYPGFGIIGEEFGDAGAVAASYRWVVDPIDGTKAFARGVPLYAVLIGLEIEGKVEVGVAYYPALDEMLSAATGEGCWWNGRRARVSAATSLARGYVCYSEFASFEQNNRAAEWARIQRAAYTCRGWSDAYGYLLVATGRAEAMLDPIMSTWDCGPFPPILQEAGGYFGDWQGNVTIRGNESLATSNTLLPDLLALIRG